MERLETKQEEIQGDKVCALVAQWKFWELVAYSGQSFPEQGEEGGADWSTRSYYPKPRRIEAMAEESLRLISTALERLQVTQSAQAWSRHLKTPDVFKPESP